MFGESIMVCPVVKAMYYDKDSLPIENSSKTREVYLPEGGWYDFWTNEYYEGGQTIVADATIDVMPLYVKAGSILPMTESMEYVDEIADATVDLHVYPGKDAEFELYEDEGDGYGYEDGEYSIRKLVWDDKKQELDIGQAIGNYKGMIKDKNFIVEVI